MALDGANRKVSRKGLVIESWRSKVDQEGEGRKIGVRGRPLAAFFDPKNGGWHDPAGPAPTSVLKEAAADGFNEFQKVQVRGLVYIFPIGCARQEPEATEIQ